MRMRSFNEMSKLEHISSNENREISIKYIFFILIETFRHITIFNEDIFILVETSLLSLKLLSSK